MNYPNNKILVTIGFSAAQVEALSQSVNTSTASVYKILQEPNLATARAKSLANLDVNCVILNLSELNIEAIRELRLHHYKLPILGWVDECCSGDSLECIQAGMQDELNSADLEHDRVSTKIEYSIARLSCQQDENTDRNYLNQLLASIPDYIYFKDVNGKFLKVSRSLAEKFNFGAAEGMIGKTDFDVHSEELARLAYQDEQNLMRTGENIIGKREHLTRHDGSTSWVSTSRVALKNAKGEVMGTMGISKEITALLESEQALAQQKEFLDTIINSIQDGIFVKDAESRYLLSNESHARSIGASSPQEVIGKFTSDFLSDSYAKSAKDQDCEILNSDSTTPLTHELMCELKNGERKLFRCTKRLVKIGTEQKKGMLGILYQLDSETSTSYKI